MVAVVMVALVTVSFRRHAPARRCPRQLYNLVLVATAATAATSKSHRSLPCPVLAAGPGTVTHRRCLSLPPPPPAARFLLLYLLPLLPPHLLPPLPLPTSTRRRQQPQQPRRHHHHHHHHYRPGVCIGPSTTLPTTINACRCTVRSYHRQLVQPRINTCRPVY